MHRKVVLLIVAGLMAVSGMFAKTRPKPIFPYQYGRRWYFAAQAGPMFTASENVVSYFDNGKGWKAFTPQASLALGYNFNDAWDMRLAGNYSLNAGACAPFNGFYPYRFQTASVFADLALNYYALGEYFPRVSPKTYLGIGMAYTFGYSEVDHPYQVVEGPNLLPGLRLGGILEFDSPGGFGWYIDGGIECFSDWYNGLEPDRFPIDMILKLSFGIIYHIPSAK